MVETEVTEAGTAVDAAETASMTSDLCSSAEA